MPTYFVTFNMTSRATVTGVEVKCDCKTVDEFLGVFKPDGLMICPEQHGEITVVNMRNVETVSVTKLDE